MFFGDECTLQMIGESYVVDAGTADYLIKVFETTERRQSGGGGDKNRRMYWQEEKG